MTISIIEPENNQQRRYAMRNFLTLSLALVCGFVAAFASIAHCDKTTQAAILIGLVCVLFAQMKK